MADTAAPPKRWVLTRLLHAAVERTEEEIAELKEHGLFARDATGPDDNHDRTVPAAKPATPASSPPAPGTPKADG